MHRCRCPRMSPSRWCCCCRRHHRYYHFVKIVSSSTSSSANSPQSNEWHKVDLLLNYSSWVYSSYHWGRSNRRHRRCRCCCFRFTCDVIIIVLFSSAPAVVKCCCFGWLQDRSDDYSMSSTSVHIKSATLFVHWVLSVHFQMHQPA